MQKYTETLEQHNVELRQRLDASNRHARELQAKIDHLEKVGEESRNDLAKAQAGFHQTMLVKK